MDLFRILKLFSVEAIDALNVHVNTIFTDQKTVTPISQPKYVVELLLGKLCVPPAFLILHPKASRSKTDEGGIGRVSE